MRSIRSVLLLPAVAALAAAGCAPPATPLEEGQATLSLSEPVRFYEAGEPVSLSVSLYNPGTEPLALDPGLWDGSRLEVASSDGEVRKAATAGDGSGGAREILDPGQRLSRDLDLAALLPSLAEPGTFLVTLAYPGFRSNTVRIQILEAYDPAADYRADVETDLGRITLAFYPDVAPAHVRNFINLARSGYFDDTLVHRIIPGVMFQAGDPTGTGRGGPGWTLKAEFNSRPHRAGTLAMARQTDNPDSAGSQWFICVDRVPEWDGLYTVFGEVVDGLDVAEAITRVPVRREAPKAEVLIRRVAIRTVEPS